MGIWSCWRIHWLSPNWSLMSGNMKVVQMSIQVFVLTLKCKTTRDQAPIMRRITILYSYHHQMPLSELYRLVDVIHKAFKHSYCNIKLSYLIHWFITTYNVFRYLKVQFWCILLFKVVFGIYLFDVWLIGNYLVMETRYLHLVLSSHGTWVDSDTLWNSFVMMVMDDWWVCWIFLFNTQQFWVSKWKVDLHAFWCRDAFSFPLHDTFIYSGMKGS